MNTVVVLVSLLLLGTALPHAARAQAGKVSSASPGKYSVAGIDDAASVERFLRDLQSAVAKNQRAKVAAMVDYPITVTANGRKTKLGKTSDLLKRYDFVFNAKVKRALAAQKPGTLFANWQGVMIGSGEIWFGLDESGKKLKIIAINN